MIICPECGKEIADDSVHCGYCGAEIESGAGKKTMIGMAPVTAEMMAKAAAEAKAAREARESAEQPVGHQGDAGDEGRLKIPKLNLPKPQGSSSSGLPSPDKLGIPRIGESSEASVSAPVEDGLSDAKTEMLSSLGGAPSTIEEKAAPSPESVAAPQSAAGGVVGFDAPREPSEGSFGAPTSRPDDDEFKMSSTEPPLGGAPDARAGEPAWAAGPVSGPAAETIPERSAPVQLGTGGGGGGGGPVVISGNTLPAKKSNTALYAIVAVAGVLLFCCVVSAVFGLLF